ncbi:MAG: hypothetical protein ACRD1I_06970, partial [Terriglobia bacterium]
RGFPASLETGFEAFWHFWQLAFVLQTQGSCSGGLWPPVFTLKKPAARGHRYSHAGILPTSRDEPPGRRRYDSGSQLPDPQAVKINGSHF